MKIPLEIQKIKHPDGSTRFRAVISFQDAIADTSQGQSLIQIQNEYAKLIGKCQKSYERIQNSRKLMADSQLQWKLANEIYSFIRLIEKDGYIFANVSEALPRDIGMSKSQFRYLIKFRTYYPSIDQVSREINWSKYREILDIRIPEKREICEQEILSGEIKTDHDIRIFKKRSFSRP